MNAADGLRYDHELLRATLALVEESLLSLRVTPCTASLLADSIAAHREETMLVPIIDQVVEEVASSGA